MDSILQSLSQPWDSLFRLIIKIITSGRSGVIMFFVLSGFVLTLSMHNRKQSYKNFIISRFFRMYPVLFISVIISYVLHAIIGNNNGELFSSWYRSDIGISIPLTIENLLGHLAVTGISKQHIYLDSPMWSLVYEFRISIIFPLLVFLMVRKNQAIVLGASIIFSLACAYFSLLTTGIAPRGYMEETFAATLLTTGYFAVFFVMGIILALKREQVSNLINKQPLFMKFVLLAVVAVCFIYDKRYFDYHSMIFDYFHAVGAIILIALAFNWHEFAQVLSIKPFLWLGRISYSLYLIHWIILYIVFELFGHVLPLWTLIAIVIITSLLAADLMARYVEYPCITLGKRLLGKNKVPKPMEIPISA